ncbi:MAG: AMP-binding protein, partial [Clostridia bacterium]|nr:AMP-binding protein [Clostridia bacterium]
MKIVGDKGYFYRKIKYFAKNYPDNLALADATGNKATFKDILTICEEAGTFIEELGLNGYERVSILSNSGFRKCLLHLPLAEKAVIVPNDSSSNPEKFKESLSLFNVDFVLTDNKESKKSKDALEAGLGIITYSFKGEYGRKHINLELVQRPAVKDRTSGFKKKHHIFIMPTSGTTSVPKIVPINYRAIQSAVEEIGERYKMGIGDVFLTPVPLHKIANMTLFRMFGLGLTFIVVDSFNPADFFKMVKEYKINLFAGMPAAYEAMLRYVNDEGIKINRGDFKVIEVFGAPLTRSLKDSLENTLKAEISQNYGMTETQHITSTYKAPQGFKDNSTGVSVLNETKVSSSGEILVRGPAVFDGYENPEEPNAKYFTDGWFHTGDVGYFDEDGY